MKRKTKPKSKLTSKYILTMHQPDGTIFVQKYPSSWASESQALEAARSKHSRYSKPFSVLRFVATTRVDPKDIQLELFA